MSEIQQQISDLRKEFYDLAIQTRERNDVLVSQLENFYIFLFGRGLTKVEIFQIINVWHKNQVCTFSSFASAILVFLRFR